MKSGIIILSALFAEVVHELFFNFFSMDDEHGDRARAQTLTIVGSLDDHDNTNTYRMRILLNDSVLYDSLAPFEHGRGSPFTFQRFSVPFPLSLIREGINRIRVGLYGTHSGDWLCWDSMYVQIGDTLLALESDVDWLGYSPTGVDVVYGGTEDTVNFQYVLASMTWVAALDDHYSVSLDKYQAIVLLNGDTLFSGNTPLPHGMRGTDGYFNNFQRWTIRFSTTMLRPGANQVTIALRGQGSNLDWFCWDSLYVNTGDSVIALESPNEWGYSPTGVAILYRGEQRQITFRHGEEPVRVLRDERPRIQRVVSTKKYRLNGQRVKP